MSTIGISAFQDCTNLESVILSGKLNEIESRVFSGCISLKSVDVPYGITSIGSWAFENCRELTEVTIPNSVESIGINAFYNSGLTSLTIPNSVNEIGQSAFQNCKQLLEVSISNGISAIGSSVFAGSGLTSISIPYGVTSIGYRSFDGCQQLKDVTIPESVTSIDMYAFQNCGLTTVKIPNSVTFIDYGAFKGCKDLVDIELSDNLDEIRSETFSDCCSLLSVVLPKGVSKIETKSFYNCTNLSSISLPTNISRISSDAFSGCVNLLEVKVTQMTPMSLFSNPFENCQNATLFVMEGSKAAYEKANVWNEFKEIVEYGDNDEDIHLLTIMPYGGSVSYQREDTWITTGNGVDNSVIKHGDSVKLKFQSSSVSVTINGKDVTSDLEGNEYTIENVTFDIVVKVAYADKESGQKPSDIHLLTIMPYGGSVSYKREDTWITGNGVHNSVVKHGDSVKLKFQSSSVSVTINGKDVTSSIDGNGYTIENITSDIEVKVAYVDEETGQIPSDIHLLTIMPYGGSVSYQRGNNTRIKRNRILNSVIKHGDSVKLQFQPSSVKGIRSVTINGKNVISGIDGNEYIIENVTSDCLVKVIYKTHNLSVISSDGGSFSYLGTTINSKTKNFTVIEGESATLTFTPNNGYQIGSLIVNDVDVTSSLRNNQYIISDISQEMTASVTFEAIPPTTYILSITSSGSGSVTYNGNTISGTTESYTVNDGSSATFTFTPNSGYRLGSVKVNGVDVTSNISNNQYTISNISKNTTVEVAFEAITYSLTIISLGNGMVYCGEEEIYNTANILSYNEGSSAKLTFSPANGYRVKLLSVNGTDVTSGIVDNQYTINDINKDTKVNVVFEAIPPTTYTLSISSSGNGAVTYSGYTINGTTRTYDVNVGSSAVLTFAPTNGYRIGCLKVNGLDVTSDIVDNRYTIDTISENTTVSVTFEVIPIYLLTITSSGYGFVAYSFNIINGNTKSFTVNDGEPVTLKLYPTEGYRVELLEVNGVDVTSSVSDDIYTIGNVDSNTTVKVSFEKIPVTPTYSLTIISLSNGKVYCSGQEIYNAAKNFTFDEGESVDLTFQPNSGYRLQLLTVDGTDVSSNVVDNKYTISNISKNTTVNVVFEAIPPTTYTLSITSSGNGTVRYSDYTITEETKSFTVNEGTSAILTITPNSGYKIGSMKVNGADVSSYISNNKCTINDIQQNISVTVTFEALPPINFTMTIKTNQYGYIGYFYTTNPSPGSDHREYNGTVTSDYSIEVIKEGAVTLTFYPNNGCELSKLVVNGADVTSKVSNSQYTVDPITTDLDIIATFQENTEPKQQIDGHEYVDLGLPSGKLWATMNYGASKPEDYGSYVYWISNGIISSSWGAGWITPTLADIKELESNCTWIWGQVNGVNGYTIKGKNGNTIFIPAAGVKVGNYSHVGEWIYYWTSTMDSEYENMAYIIMSTASNVAWGSLNSTFTEIPIRPVSKDGKVVTPTTYTLSISSTGSGYVTYSGNTISGTTKSFAVNKGTSVSLSFTPNSSYQVWSLKVNGVDVTSGISNNQYVINSISKNTTVVVTFEEKVIPDGSMVMYKDVNYRVLSGKDKTVNVANGEYTQSLDIPATIAVNDITLNVRGIESNVMTNNPQLAAVIWNPAVKFDAKVSNPNFLLYVTSAEYAPSGIKNVIVNGTANSITLTDADGGNDFCCPKAFAARSISYTHNYSMVTGVGECRGWETIALPFNVQKIAHSEKGQVVPFAVWQKGETQRPFWLYELTGNGWKEAGAIKAYTPYVISMPNNELYHEASCLNGRVTFSAENVTVRASSNNTPSYNGKTFVPNFSTRESNSHIYALNVNNDWMTYNGNLAEGSHFVQNLRTVHPFEAYMIVTGNNARALFGIFDDDATEVRGIKILLNQRKGTYNLNGQKLDESTDRKLPAGVYIIDGQKVMVK